MRALRFVPPLLLALLTSAAVKAQPVALTQTSVNCGSSSTKLLAAGAAKNIIRVHIPSGGITVWFDWSGNAAVAAAPSEDMTAGSTVWWSAAYGYLPNTDIYCIAASTQAVVVEYR